MPHHDPVVATFFDVYGIGSEVSSKGEMEELTAISEILLGEALAELYEPGEAASLHERTAIVCMMLVVCDCVASQVTLDDGSHVNASDIAYEILPHLMSRHSDPDPEADAKSTFGSAWADSFQLALLWMSKINEKSEKPYAAALELGNSAITLFQTPRDSECIVRLRRAAFLFF